MLSRQVWGYPGGGDVAMPGPPAHWSMTDPAAGTSGPLECSRFGGRDDTLLLVGPCGAGDLGYMGRDITDPNTAPVPESRGMFWRLHQEGGN